MFTHTNTLKSSMCVKVLWKVLVWGKPHLNHSSNCSHIEATAASAKEWEWWVCAYYFGFFGSEWMYLCVCERKSESHFFWKWSRVLPFFVESLKYTQLIRSKTIVCISPNIYMFVSTHVSPSHYIHTFHHVLHNSDVMPNTHTHPLKHIHIHAPAHPHSDWHVPIESFTFLNDQEKENSLRPSSPTISLYQFQNSLFSHTLYGMYIYIYIYTFNRTQHSHIRINTTSWSYLENIKTSRNKSTSHTNKLTSHEFSFILFAAFHRPPSAHHARARKIKDNRELYAVYIYIYIYMFA